MTVPAAGQPQPGEQAPADGQYGTSNRDDEGKAQELLEEPSAPGQNFRNPPDDRPTKGGSPPHRDIKAVALLLLWIFGGCLVAVIGLVVIVAWRLPDGLQDVIGFYGSIVTMLGTLLGGVVAFYFARDSSG